MELTSTEIKEHFKKLKEDGEYMTMGSVIVQIEKLERKKDTEMGDQILDNTIGLIKSLKGKYDDVHVFEDKGSKIGPNWNYSDCILIECRNKKGRII